MPHPPVLRQSTPSFIRRLTHTSHRGAATIGRRTEGEKNLKKHHDPASEVSASTPSAFDERREKNFPVDPKSNPDDYSPYSSISGDYNRSGMRTTEYRNVDKGKEPYSPTGGEHRYGGRGKEYEWNADRLKRESKK